MQAEDGEHDQTENPDKGTKIMKMLGIGVDPIGTPEDGRVAEQVNANKGDQDKACYGHQDLSAHGALSELHDFHPLE
jgi:hypothetical protein